MDALPGQRGSYALHLLLPQQAIVTIGRLGRFDFPAGHYLYFGSGFGSGGLRARLAHHLRPAVNPRWHLDYLHPIRRAIGGWYSTAALECAWSQRIASQARAVVVAPGFGAADCRSGCAAHLLYLPDWRPEQVALLLAQAACQPVYSFVAPA